MGRAGCAHRAVCPQVGPKGGRPPFAVEQLLKFHFLQQWFDLPDMTAELYHTPLLASLRPLSGTA